jgi:hypothetical protein
MDTGNHAATAAGQTPAGGSRTILGAPPADKQKSNCVLSEKVQEVAQFYMNQRSGAHQGLASLAPSLRQCLKMIMFLNGLAKQPKSTTVVSIHFMAWSCVMKKMSSMIARYKSFLRWS